MELKFRVWDNKRKMFVPNNFVIFSFHYIQNHINLLKNIKPFNKLSFIS